MAAEPINMSQKHEVTAVFFHNNNSGGHNNHFQLHLSLFHDLPEKLISKYVVRGTEFQDFMGASF